MGKLLGPAVFWFALPLSIHAQAAGMVYDQPAAGDRLVVMEAESAFQGVAAGGDAWTLATAATAPAAPAGFVGGGAMVCLPDNGSGNTGATTFVNGARLNFRVLFRVPGVHYVWVRGRAIDNTAATPSQPPGNNDSCHVALNGVAAPEGFQMTGFAATEWRWIRARLNGYASVNVPAAGVHTVNLCMREDGLLVDRLLLTTSAAYAPNPVTTAGPAATAQISDQIVVAPTLSGGAGPMVHNLSWTASPYAAGYTLERAPETGETWTPIVSQAGTAYADTALVQGQIYRYRVFADQPSIHFSAGPSNIVTLSPGAPPPRVEDGNSEGLIDDHCACGSSISAAPGMSFLPALLGLLLPALRKRPASR